MRIVSLLPGATEIVAALGLEDRLVGVSHVCDHPASVRDLPSVTSTTVPADASSGEIDRQVKESVAGAQPPYRLDHDLLERLEPDLVITQGICDVCAVGESLARACLSSLSTSPTVISLHPHRFDDVLEDVLSLGSALGKAERAASFVARCRARVRAVEERVADREPVDVVVLEWTDPLFSAGHWTPDLVRMAGGRELLAEPGSRSRELEWGDVLAADPEALVLACCGQDVPRSLEDLTALRRRTGYDDLRAVRTGRVFVGDGGAHFSRPGPRLVDGVETLADWLHPRAPRSV